MDYKNKGIEYKLCSMYSINKKENMESQESILEKIASSYTKLPDIRSKDYNIDKCNCGNCGCVDTEGGLILILSPVGIAASISAFGPISAMD